MPLGSLLPLTLETVSRLLGEISFQAAVILVIAGSLGLVLRRAAARHRQAMWSAALIGLLMLPVLSVVTPSWSLGWFDAPGSGVASAAIEAARATELRRFNEDVVDPTQPLERSDLRSRPVSIDSAALPSGSPDGSLSPSVAGRAEPTTQADSAPSTAALVLGFWLLGAGLSLGWFGLGLVRLRGILRSSQDLASPWLEALAEATETVGVRRPVRLRVSRDIAGPMTCGWLRPHVVLPASALDWSAERRRIVLLHELVHIRRSDWLFRSLARLACALYWLNPLAWLGVRRLVAAQEQACDDEVVALGTRPSTYARHLLDLARSMIESRNSRVVSTSRTSIHPAPLMLEMARHTTMEGRLMSILDPSRQTADSRRGERNRRSPISLIAAAMLLLPLIAAVDPWSANADPDPAQSANAARGSAPARDLAEVVAEIEAIQIRVEPFQRELEAIRERMQPLQVELEGIQKRLEPSQARIAATGPEIEPYQEQLAALHAEIEPLQARLETVQGDLQPHQQRLESFHSELDPLQQRLEAIGEEMEPVQQELEALAKRLEPFHEQMTSLHEQMESLHGADHDAVDHSALGELQERMEAIHRDMEPIHQEMSRVHDRMEPYHQRMETVHREMKPVHERMSDIHSDMEPVHERMAAIHREMKPILERMEAVHRKMEPVHQRMASVHAEMEPVHREMEQVHRRMEPMHREMEAVHQRMEPLHREMEAVHEELMDSLHREVRQRLASALGRSPSDAEIVGAADKILERVSIDIEDGRIKLRNWRNEGGLEAIVAKALGLASSDPAVARVVAGISEIDASQSE